MGNGRRSSKYEVSSLNESHLPPSPESPVVGWGEKDGEGFSTVYGASASSRGGASESEVEEDRFVSARGGEETEVDHTQSLAFRRSSGEKERQDRSSVSGGSGQQMDDAPVLERKYVSKPRNTESLPADISRLSPPLINKNLRKNQLLHPIPATYTLLPIQLLIPGLLNGKVKKAAGVSPSSLSLTRKTCENGILLGAVLCGVYKLGHDWDEKALAGGE